MAAFFDFVLVDSDEEMETSLQDRIYEGTKCGYTGCNKRSTFNFPGYKAGWCGTHKKEGHVDVKNKKCLEMGCYKQPAFGPVGTTKSIYCAIHKKIDHVNIRSKKCLETDCDKQPTFGLSGSKNALYCKDHKRPEHVDVKSKKCLEEGCTIQPVFGLADSKIAIYCARHRKPEHLDLKNKRCIEEGCTKHSNFGSADTKRVLYCVLHKRPGDIDLTGKICRERDCMKHPNFGPVGTKEAIYCAAHKKPEHVDLKSRRCSRDGCSKQPHFGFLGDTKASYCSIHRSSDMIRLRKKSCVFSDEHGQCKVTPSFGFEKEGLPLYCRQHAVSNPNLVIVTRKIICKLCSKHACYGVPSSKRPSHCKGCAEPGMLNLIDLRCNYIDSHSRSCSTIANYNIPGQKALRCAKHKLHGFVLHPKARCKTRGCSNTAIHGHSSKPTHCEDHKETGQKDLVQHRCLSCGLFNLVDLAGLCTDCNGDSPFEITPYTTNADIPSCSPFYQGPRASSSTSSEVELAASSSPAFERARLAKQNRVQELLEASSLIPDSIDLPLDRGECILSRPDFLFWGQPEPSHIVILEVDENQHSSYSCECEVSRMINIAQALSGMPVHFLRYNPDTYRRPDQKMREQHEPETKRHQILLEYLRATLKTSPVEQGAWIQVTYLFYDDYLPGQAPQILQARDS